MAGGLSKKLKTDFLWYLTGSFVPAMVSIVRLPIFTRYFTPEEYGYYSLVTVTFTYLSITLYSWISSCLWRYYTPYKENRQLPLLYSNLALLYLISTFLIVCISVMWMAFIGNQLVFRLVFSTMIFIVINQLVGFVLVVYRIQKKAFFYNLLFSLQALLAFGFMLFMIFGREYRIEAIPFAQATIAAILLIFLTVLNGPKIKKLTCFTFLSLTHRTQSRS